MRPIEANFVPERPTEQLIHRDVQRPGFDVEQGVLNGADGLLDHPTAGLAPQSKQRRDDGFISPRVFAHNRRGEMVDHCRHPSAAKRLIVLTPADQAFVSSDFQEVEIALAGVSM